jgi:hypothetical protein
MVDIPGANRYRLTPAFLPEIPASLLILFASNFPKLSITLPRSERSVRFA